MADYTKYNLCVGNESYSKLPKRRFIFHLVKAVLGNGGSPENVESVLPSGKFKSIGSRAEQEDLDPGWWYCKKDEIFHVEGKTWILSKKWGDCSRYIVLDVARKLRGMLPPGLKCHWMPA